jgi:hypothetical protein
MLARWRGAARRFASTFPDRFAAWCRNTFGEFEFVTDRDLHQQATDLYRGRVMHAFSEYVQTVHYDQKLNLRHESRGVLCECGAFSNSRDVCPGCGGGAVPMAFPRMVAHLARAQVTAERSYQRAAARRLFARDLTAPVNQLEI